MTDDMPEELLNRIVDDMKNRQPRIANARAIVWRVLNAVLDRSLDEAIGRLYRDRLEWKSK